MSRHQPNVTLPTPTVVAEHIASLWALSRRADSASATSGSPDPTRIDRAEASAIHDEAERRVFMLWSLLSMLEPADATDAFVLAIRAHDLATDLAHPGFADAKQTTDALAELRQITGTLTAFLGRSAGTTADALGLGWASATSSPATLADWPRTVERMLDARPPHGAA